MMLATTLTPKPRRFSAAIHAPIARGPRGGGMKSLLRLNSVARGLLGPHWAPSCPGDSEVKLCWKTDSGELASRPLLPLTPRTVLAVRTSILSVFCKVPRLFFLHFQRSAVRHEIIFQCFSPLPLWG